MKQLNKYKSIITDFIFYLAILFFIIGFNFSDNMAGGWYQQFMPNLNGRQISDITFVDSLTGYAIGNSTSDTNYFLKTTNGGDNWQIIYRRFLAFEKLQFLNLNTGYMCGAYLWKTIDGGYNWSQLSAPPISPEELYVLNEDTIWIISSNSLTGGVYRTTDGGANWEQQINLGSDNPNRIYMFNSRIGFITEEGSGNRYVRRTTNGGLNWDQIITNDDFHDIYFADSLLGWKSSAFGFKKTTNGGLNWVTQTFPQGGIIQGNGISSFSNINRDTIWGNGGYVLYPNNQVRGILNRTTNGGDTWLFQIPDTSIHIAGFDYTNFINKLNGWVYNIATGIHTTTGGNDTFYTSIKELNKNIPNNFRLYQNYPNPFNPQTTIKFELKSTADIKIVVYDVTGKEVTILADKEYKAGTYEIKFNGTNYSSGVYFYTLFADKNLIDTKAMVIIK
jgi:photosystem II stability/assembly factor-like uncharacterized protein